MSRRSVDNIVMGNIRTGRLLTPMEIDAKFYGLSTDERVRFYVRVVMAQGHWEYLAKTRRDKRRMLLSNVVCLVIIAVLAVIGYRDALT